MTDWATASRDYLDGLAARPAARQPASFGEIWSSQWDAAGLETAIGVTRPLNEAYQDLETGIEKATGQSAAEAARDRGLELGQAASIDERAQMLGSVIDALPEEQRKPLEPLRDVRSRAADKAAAIERDAGDVATATYGLSGNATAWLAGVARHTVDPVNLGLMAVAGPLAGKASTAILPFLLREAGAGAGIQAVQEPWIQMARSELGLESGFKQALVNVGEAGIGAAGLAGLFRGAAAGWRLAFPRAAGADLAAPGPRTPAEPAAATGESAPSGATPISAELGGDALEVRMAELRARMAEAAAGIRIEPAVAAAIKSVAPEDFEAAARIAERDQLVEAQRPEAVDHAEHLATIEHAQGAIETNEPARLENVPPPFEQASDFAGRASKEKPPAIEPEQPEPAISDIPLPGARPPRGPRARPEDTWSLFEFLASRGGLAPHSDLAAILDGNPFVPGFGKLIRKGGMPLDRAREAAIGAKYLLDASDMRGGEATVGINDLLKLIEEEARGQRQYIVGREPGPSKAELARGEDEAKFRTEGDLDQELAAAGIDPRTVDAGIRKRAVEIVHKEREPDVLVAYERAVMENAERLERKANVERTEQIPGWDVPAEPGSASGGGGAAARSDVGEPGGPGAGGKPGGPARELGESDRAPAATELTPAGEQRLIPGVEPVSTKQRLEAEAAKPLRGGSAPPPAGGIFDLEARAQTDLVDLARKPGGMGEAEQAAFKARQLELPLRGDRAPAKAEPAEAKIENIPIRFPDADHRKLFEIGRKLVGAEDVRAAELEQVVERFKGYAIEEPADVTLATKRDAAELARDYYESTMEEARKGRPVEPGSAGRMVDTEAVPAWLERQVAEARARTQELAGKLAALGDPALAADAARVLEEAGGDLEIVIPDVNGEMKKISARQALEEAREDARAAAELAECAGISSRELGLAFPQEHP